MAATSVILDIRANTTRALSEFKRFSAQLDNKFLISGLKLDVVRSALGQINREFQRAIGEQGLASGQSLRAAQNQAALILDTFKSVGIESSASITEQFSNAFSEIAITAGGTADDIKKALGASAWISTNLAEDVRKQLAEGVLTFQRDARRAGLGDNYAEIIQQFLAGQVTAGDLIQSGGALEKAIGVGLTNIAGTPELLATAEQRSKVLAEFQTPERLRMLGDMIARADWGFTIIEDLNARLFNPERGVFGVLRQVTMAVGDKTNILQETRALIDSIFGKQGLFVTFFEQVGKIFGIEDPLKVVIRGVRWITRQFNELNEFLQSPEMQAIVGILKSAFNGVKDFITKIYDSTKTNLENPDSTINQIGAQVKGFFTTIHETIKSGDWDPTNVSANIKEIGKDVREFIKNIGKSFRNIDISKQGTFILEIVGTLVEEVTKTLATLIKEGLQTLFSEKGQLAFGGILDIINRGLRGFFSELFGDGAGSVLAKIGTAGIAAAFGKKLLAGMLGFGALLIAALPGGQLINRAIRTRVTNAINALGRNISQAITNIPSVFARNGSTVTPAYPGAQFNSGRIPTPTRGAENIFQQKVLAYLNAITKCVCGPAGGPGQGRRPRPPIQGPVPPPPQPRPRFTRARFGRGAAVAGGIALGAGAIGLASGGGNSAVEGAANGAMMGMLFGPKGAIAGAILGGITSWIGSLEESSDKTEAVLKPLREAFKQITSATSSIFKGLWTAIESVVFSIGNVLKIFGGFSGQTDDATKSIIAFKVILTPVVAAFQLLEQVANTLGFAFLLIEGATLTLRLAFSKAAETFGLGSQEGRERLEQERQDYERRLHAGGAAFGRSSSQHGSWYSTPPARALGGPVTEGVAYKVGERGPELFVPGVNGTVINNMALTRATGDRGTSSTSVTNNFSIVVNVNGGLVLDDMEDFEIAIIDVINKSWTLASNGTASRGTVI